MEDIDEALRSITHDVLSSLGHTPEPRNAPCRLDALTSSVEIDGASSATLAVHLSPALVSELAAGLLCDDAIAPSEADVADVAGEIANMIGGNLKSILPGPNRLSLPAHGDGPMPTSGLPANAPRPKTFYFECEAGCFAVTVTFHGGRRRDEDPDSR